MITLPFRPKEAFALEGIPGLHLKLMVPEPFATGSIDALHAGFHALGRPLPGLITLAAAKKIVPPLVIKGARSYQNEGIRWGIETLQHYGACIIADEMGLGKTFQAIHILKCVMLGRTLILCPGSVRETWRNELLKWGYKANEIHIMYPGAKPVLWSPRIVVCSYHHDMINRAMDQYFTGEYPEFLIMDEAHMLRGRDSKRAAVMDTVAPLIPYKIALTGTPQWSSMKDWYQLLHILFANSFGNQWDFDKRYCGAVPGKHGGLEYDKKAPLHSEELALRLKYYMIAREKVQVAKELPPLTVSVRWVDGTPEAKKAFMKMQLNIGKGSVTDAILATLRGKVDEVLRLAQEARRFVLTTWTNTGAAELHRLLNEAGTPCILVTSSMSGPRREQAIQLAVAQKCGLVATHDLFAVGLNLQEVSSTGILHALDWVPLKLAQLFNRLHRINTVNPVTWHVVAMRESIDQVLVDTCVNKLDQFRSVMGKTKHRNMRHALADSKSNQSAEKAALASIYEALEVKHADQYESTEEDEG